VTRTDRSQRQRARRVARRRRLDPDEEVPTEPKRVAERFRLYRETHDRALRNELVEEHRWLAQHCARRFARKGEPLDDLVQVATVGVLKAVERFDPTFGVVFTTFAMPTVMGELRRHFRDRTWSVHVPRRAKELYQSVSGVAEELSQTLMRSPTVPEIAQRAGTTVEDALEALEVRASYRGVPLAPPGDDERTEGPGFGRHDHGYDAAEARLTVGRLLDTLPTRDRRIVEMRFIDGMTQSQIASVVGVSQVQVSRLLRAALDRMRRPLTSERV
jgi:RNA polymerase sigma-B factor